MSLRTLIGEVNQFWSSWPASSERETPGGGGMSDDEKPCSSIIEGGGAYVSYVPPSMLTGSEARRPGPGRMASTNPCEASGIKPGPAAYGAAP